MTAPLRLALAAGLWRPLWRPLWALLLGLLLGAWPAPDARAATDADAQAAALVVGHRELVVFRAPLGAFTPAERAETARQRIERALALPGEGWTSVRPQAPGVMVELDGQPLFMVLPGDADAGRNETAEGLANAASRQLQAVWRDARAQRDPHANWLGLLKVALALLALAVALYAAWRLTRWLQDVVTDALADRVEALPDAMLASRISPLLLSLASRSCVLAAWLLSLLLCFLFVAFALDQFALTKALGDGLLQAFTGLLVQGLGAVAGAVPGMFIAGLIFLTAWVVTQVSSEIFLHVASGRLKLGMLDQHTAPTTRHIVNASLWLFALAMAYPYLPGAETEAFKGLSVLVGIMVSIGASGLIGQVASGVILVYTRALSLGEYVRIQDSEGTVTGIGLIVTRLRTGLGAEISLPNALVLGNVTRNYSRATPGPGFALDTSVTIGYDTPWRQVHALLLEAAAQVPHLQRLPAPYVVQTALSDFYVAYKLVVQVDAADPDVRARVISDLHGAIQDQFNRYGVPIMSPNYYEDPVKPKVVPEADWYAPPARRDGGGEAPG